MPKKHRGRTLHLMKIDPTTGHSSTDSRKVSRLQDQFTLPRRPFRPPIKGCRSVFPSRSAAQAGDTGSTQLRRIGQAVQRPIRRCRSGICASDVPCNGLPTRLGPNRTASDKPFNAPQAMPIRYSPFRRTTQRGARTARAWSCDIGQIVQRPLPLHGPGIRTPATTVTAFAIGAADSQPARQADSRADRVCIPCHGIRGLPMPSAPPCRWPVDRRRASPMVR